jgi:succinate dehydrogenase hydrophobic anchor subunit
MISSYQVVQETKKESPHYEIILLSGLVLLFVVGIVLYFAFPHTLSSQESLVEESYRAPGNFPDDTLVPLSTQAIHQWYIRPLEEETVNIPYYPYVKRRFHDPANPVFY